MARLSQQALSEAAQSFLHAGVSDVRNMDSLQEALVLMRGRVRDTPASTDLVVQKHGMSRAIQPLVAWVLAEGDLAELSFQARSDLIWNLYTSAVSRTAGAEAFPQVTASEEAWNDAVLQSMGHEFPTSLPVLPPCKVSSLPLVAWGLVIGGVGLLVLDAWVLSGRWRFYMLLLGMFSIMLGLMGLFWSVRAKGEVPNMDARSLAPRVRQSSAILGGTTGLDREDAGGDPSAPPPGLAPCLPGSEQLMAPASSTLMSQRMAGATVTELPVIVVGDAVVFTGAGESAPLTGQQGIVLVVQQNRVEVQLQSGLRVGPMAMECVTKGGPPSLGATAAPTSAVTMQGQNYAPFTLGENDTKVQLQAGRLKSALEKSSGLQATIPTWGQLFWQAVKNESDLYGLEAPIRNVLSGHGYIGAATTGPPRVEELKKQLIQLEALGGPPHGSGGSVLRVSGLEGTVDPESMAWHLKLPADLQRAGPEIYRNIRSEGVSSVRQWVNEQHPTLEQKSSPQYQDLFTTATIVDFEVAGCHTEGMLMQKLATSDALEIHLRKLGAFIYLRRTKDKTGANRILGVKAPGTNTDIAPKWLLDDANLHSKTEFQRQERGAKASKYEGGGSGEIRYRRGGGKGSGGGGGKGGGRSKKGGQPTQG